MDSRLGVRRFFAFGTIAACFVLSSCSGGSIPSTPAIGQIGSALRGHAFTYKLLYNFATSVDPEAPLISVNGTLYGTAYGNTTGDYGSVFRITPAGVEKVLYRFKGGADGGFPKSSLLYLNGYLYGTTYAGNAGSGVVFRVNASTGKENVVYSFGTSAAGYDGTNPGAGLVYYNGTFYGTTERGGTNRAGLVFSLTPAGKEKVLHNFLNGNSNDGCAPQAGLIVVNGLLYGTTPTCGSTGNGIVFSVTTGGTEKIVHTFASSDGIASVAPLVYVNGSFYGTTQIGGPQQGDGGTVFQMSPTGVVKVLHVFGTYSSGYQPYAGLTFVKDHLYGTTNEGGQYGRGTLFRISLTGTGFMVLHSFGNGKDGAQPHASVLRLGSTLYGTTTLGGAKNQGTVYTLAF